MGVNVIAPAEVLAADPLPDAVAVMQLAVAASAHRAGGVKVRLLHWLNAHWIVHVGCRRAALAALHSRQHSRSEKVWQPQAGGDERQLSWQLFRK